MKKPVKLNINHKTTVIEDIMKLADDEGMTLIDAALEYGERNQIDAEIIGEIIKGDELLKSKIEIEAEGLHFLVPIERLPL